MLNWSYNLCIWVHENHGLIPAAMIVCSLNMLIQILIDWAFGSKGLPKLRGYRGE